MIVKTKCRTNLEIEISTESRQIVLKRNNPGNMTRTVFMLSNEELKELIAIDAKAANTTYQPNHPGGNAA